MLQCTAVKLLPVRDVLALLKANREEPYDHAEFADGAVAIPAVAQVPVPPRKPLRS